MNIAIIGSGNMGMALTASLGRAGHHITIGSRNPASVKVPSIIGVENNVLVDAITSAVAASDVLIITVPLKAVLSIVDLLPDVREKIIIETTNGFGTTIPGYENAIDAIKKLTGCQRVARCFNTIGAENITDLIFNGIKADAFMAGDSIEAKETARRLATDIGFGQCYDLGGDSQLQQLENLSMIWSSLAYNGKLGRRIGFKILS